MTPGEQAMAEFCDWWSRQLRDLDVMELKPIDKEFVRILAADAWLESRCVEARRELAALGPDSIPVTSIGPGGIGHDCSVEVRAEDL